MAWGGASGGFGGPSAVSSSAAAGLPFAGVPPELADRVEAILETEPEHPRAHVPFTQVEQKTAPFTLRRFLATRKPAMAGAFALVLVETLTMQAGPLLTQRAIDKGILAKSMQVLIVASVLYAISVVISMIASGFRVAWTGKVGEALLYDLRVRVFAHLQRLSMDFFTGEKAGRVMTRMTSDIEALSQLFQDGIVNLAVQALTMVIVTIILFLLNPALAAITVLLVVPTMTIATVWYRKASDRGYTRVRERIAEVLADLQESLSGIRIISAHNRRRHNVQQHRNIVGEYRGANQYTARVSAVYGPATDLIGAAGQAVVLLVGGNMVLNGTLTIGQLTAFVLYLAAFFAPIQQLVQLYTTYQSGQAAVDKLQELLATEPSVPERADAVDLPPIAGHVVLDHVSFGYTSGQAVLHDVTLDIAPGETFALVGATGAGKSTIAKLVTRFYDPTQGTVSIDGHDLRDVTLESLRRQLGVVPQEAFLFAGSVRSNVTFARPDATDEEVDEACRAVGLDELVDRLPQGLDTLVHERGATLSSGERQLLALTRAFLARPRVLVLDEATANLDLRSEAQVEHGLDALLEGRTAILIAHRLATAMRADRIAVVDDGEVIELGSHAELLAQRGQYAAMFETWQRHMSGRGASTNGNGHGATTNGNGTANGNGNGGGPAH
jgi:ATP-binding cassette, subfamily B, bacterial